MNDKFFDLPRVKQDRMINGALEVFAKNGYKHASTDDMVKAVGVSKGLWFHYFGSKPGIYTFVYGYSVKYMLLELSTIVDENERDFLELTRQIELAKSRVGRNYPYMVLFLNEAVKETDENIIFTVEEEKKVLEDKLADILKNSEIKGIEDKNRREKVKRMVTYMVTGITREKTYEGVESDAIYREIRGYLDLIGQMSVSLGKAHDTEFENMLEGLM